MFDQSVTGMTVCPCWRSTLALRPGRSPFNRRSGAQLQKVYDHRLVHGQRGDSDWGLNVSWLDEISRSLSDNFLLQEKENAGASFAAVEWHYLDSY
jgi:hypothetical protein